MFPILIPWSSQISFCAISFLSFGWQYLHSWVHSCFLLYIGTRQVGLIYDYIFKSSVLVFCRNSLFYFCLANSECDTYLASWSQFSLKWLPYNVSTIFQPNLEPGLNPSFLDSQLVFFMFSVPGSSYNQSQKFWDNSKKHNLLGFSLKKT